MKVTNLEAPVMKSWLVREGCRLDASPFLSGAVESRVLLEKLPAKKEPLLSLTQGHDGGIYNGPQFSRNYVESEEFGVRFVSSGSMLLADLSNLPYLRKKDAHSSKLSYLKLEEGMTLISCSGTIGRMVYVRPDMEDIWSSQHIMKVVPNRNKIPAGYLFSFLNCKFGIPLITSNTYGAIIPHIEPKHIEDLPVPRLPTELEEQVHFKIKNAASLRSQASGIIAGSGPALLNTIGIGSLINKSVGAMGSASVQSSKLDGRLDATYHSLAAIEAEHLVLSAHVPSKTLFDVGKRLFKPPMFKRLWVDDARYGRQFVSGQDAYRWPSREKRFVSYRTPDFEKFILERGWVVIQAAGQIYGLFGQPLYVRGWLEGLFCADDMYRIVPHNEIDGAYIYAWLRTPHGEALIKRQACGYSIPRVWDPHVSKVLIPWPAQRIREAIAEPIIRAHDELEEARKLEESAISQVEEWIVSKSGGA
jgi:type I restriction enzyme S subunit